MEQTEQIIVFNSLFVDKCHRQIVTINSTIQMKQLRQVIKQSLKICTQHFKLYFHTYDLIYLPLDSYTFEYFRNNLKINKLIKVIQYSPLEMALPIHSEEQQVQKGKKGQQEQRYLGGAQIQTVLPCYELKNDSICSFFADQIHQIADFFPTLELESNTQNSPKRSTS